MSDTTEIKSYETYATKQEANLLLRKILVYKVSSDVGAICSKLKFFLFHYIETRNSNRMKYSSKFDSKIRLPVCSDTEQILKVNNENSWKLNFFVTLVEKIVNKENQVFMYSIFWITITYQIFCWTKLLLNSISSKGHYCYVSLFTSTIHILLAIWKNE